MLPKEKEKTRTPAMQLRRQCTHPGYSSQAVKPYVQSPCGAISTLDRSIIKTRAAPVQAQRKHPNYAFGFLLPMFHPQPRRTLTILGVTAAVSGTRTNMKDLWMA